MNPIDENIRKIIQSAGIEDARKVGSRLLPETIEECSRILKAASDNRINIRIVGNGSQSQQLEDCITLSTSKLSIEEEIDYENSTLTIGSGSDYSKFEKMTTDFSFSPSEFNGTIGGCISGAKSLPASLDLKDRLLMMKCVLPTGKVMELGSKAVKDVAGYDLAPLFFGAYGKLGLIASVTLNLAPMVRFRNNVVGEPVLHESESSDEIGGGLSKIIAVFDPAGIFR